MKNRAVKDYLLRLRKLDKLIQNKLWEIENLRDIALGITAARTEGDRVQSSGSKERMADAVAKCIDLEAEINSHIDELYEEKLKITRQIEQLDVMEYELLHLVYVRFLDLASAAEVMQRSYSTITNLHGLALKNLRVVLDREGVWLKQ